MRVRRTTLHPGRHLRRGQVVAMVAISMTTLVGFAALAIDVGLLYQTRTELQRTADAAALAAAWELVQDESRLQGDVGVSLAADDSRTRAVALAARNPVLSGALQLDRNDVNASDGDIVFGYLAEPANQATSLLPCVDTRTNAVQVIARRSVVRNGPVPLLFASIFGLSSSNVSASAVAAYEGGVVGFRVTPETGNAGVLPMTLRDTIWNGLQSGTYSIGDNYAYDPVTKQVTPGQDGIQELNLFPGAGEDQLPPGNFGTVDIGPDNNSASDLARQIREGISQADMDAIGGSLELGPDGVLYLNGDTGVSAGIKDDLAAIVSQARTIPIFSDVVGNGNNATFSVVAWAGVRIMDVKLTGAMNKKYVVIQPAVVVDDTAITDPSAAADESFIHTPPRLVR